MDSIIKKHCNSCDNDLPATEEYFYTSYLRDHRNQCKSCHKKRPSVTATSRDRLLEVAQLIQHDEVPSYQSLSSVAKSIGWTATKVEHDIYENKLQVFKFIYNKVGPALALRLEDARSYIATHSLNGNSQTETHIKEAETAATPSKCDSCGDARININLLGDMNDITYERYGYLCMKCRPIVQASRGNPIRIRNVLVYVEKTRLSRV